MGRSHVYCPRFWPEKFALHDYGLPSSSRASCYAIEGLATLFRNLGQSDPYDLRARQRGSRRPTLKLYLDSILRPVIYKDSRPARYNYRTSCRLNWPTLRHLSLLSGYSALTLCMYLTILDNKNTIRHIHGRGIPVLFRHFDVTAMTY